MGGIPDDKRIRQKPFLITKDEAGRTRLYVRETRFNGQGYPIVTVSAVEEAFDTAGAARAHAKAHFGAQPGEFATK